MAMYFLSVGVRHSVTGDTRHKTFTFDPADLDAAKMAALRSRILAWASEMDTAAASNTEHEPL